MELVLVSCSTEAMKVMLTCYVSTVEAVDSVVVSTTRLGDERLGNVQENY